MTLTDQSKTHSMVRKMRQVDDDLVYDLFTTGRWNLEMTPLELLTHTRQQIEDLPPTATTFRLKRIFGDHPTFANTQSYAPDHLGPLMELVGAWKEPPHFEGGDQRHIKWVNPHAKFAYKYSDCFVQCECGTVQTFLRAPSPVESITLDDHDECYTLWRRRAGLEVMENRKKTLERYITHSWPSPQGDMDRSPSAEQTLKRIGYQPQDGMGHIRRQLNFDIHGLRDEAARRLAHTTMHLIQHHTAGEIAEAFGVGRSTLRRFVRDEFGGDVDFHWFRRYRGGGIR